MTTSAAGDLHIKESYDVSAPAEVVFDVLTDPDRTSRWLPRGMNTETAGAGEVRIRVGERVHAYEFRSVPEELELTWRSIDGTGPHGTARVTEAPAGGSEVHTELVVPGAVAGEQRVRELLAETVEHLRRDVEDNFSAG